MIIPELCVNSKTLQKTYNPRLENVPRYGFDLEECHFARAKSSETSSGFFFFFLHMLVF